MKKVAILFLALTISILSFSQVVTITGKNTRESFGIFDDTTNFIDIATNTFYEYPYQARETDVFTYIVDFKSNTVIFLDSDLSTLYALPFTVNYKNSDFDFLIKLVYDSEDSFGIFVKDNIASYYQRNEVAATLTIFKNCKMSVR
jgi:hypothetical protein